MSNYLNTLTNTSAFPLEVQSAASALAPSKDALHAAIDGAIAAPETENSLSGDHADLLERGFEYATQVVKMLAGEPAAEEKLDVRSFLFFLLWSLVPVSRPGQVRSGPVRSGQVRLR